MSAEPNNDSLDVAARFAGLFSYHSLPISGISYKDGEGNYGGGFSINSDAIGENGLRDTSHLDSLYSPFNPSYGSLPLTPRSGFPYVLFH